MKEKTAKTWPGPGRIHLEVQRSLGAVPGTVARAVPFAAAGESTAPQDLTAGIVSGVMASLLEVSEFVAQEGMRRVVIGGHMNTSRFHLL